MNLKQNKSILISKLKNINTRHFLELCSYQNKELLEAVRYFYSKESEEDGNEYKKNSIRAIVGGMIENYIFEDILQNYSFTNNNMTKISFSKNNIKDVYTEDIKINNTNMYIDIKSKLVPYHQTKHMDPKTTISISKKTLKRYYEKIKNKQADDIWLMTYYNYSPYQSDIVVISVKKLYDLYEGCGTELELKNFLELTINGDEYVFYNRRICYSLEEFMSHLMDS